MLEKCQTVTIRCPLPHYIISVLSAKLLYNESEGDLLPMSFAENAQLKVMTLNSFDRLLVGTIQNFLKI